MGGALEARDTAPTVRYKSHIFPQLMICEPRLLHYRILMGPQIAPVWLLVSVYVLLTSIFGVATATSRPSVNHVAIREDNSRLSSISLTPMYHRHYPHQKSASTHRYLGRTIRPATRLVRNSINHEHIHELRISSGSKLVRRFLRVASSPQRSGDVERWPLLAPNHSQSRSVEAHPRHAPSLYCAAHRVELFVLFCDVYADLGTEWVHRNRGDNVSAHERDQVGRFLLECRGFLKSGGVLDNGSMY